MEIADDKITFRKPVVFEETINANKNLFVGPNDRLRFYTFEHLKCRLFFIFFILSFSKWCIE